MVSNRALKLQQSPTESAPAGCWRLAPREALTLQPGEAGVFKVARGRVWATLGGPHQGPANDWGDVVLSGGEQLALMPGQQVVVEPFGDAVNQPVYFCWEPAAARAPIAPEHAPAWSDALARPSLDFGVLPAISAGVVAQLLGRIASTLSMLVAGRGRVLSPLESNQP